MVPKYHINVRVNCGWAFYALFMNDMLIRPIEDVLKEFGEQDY